MNGEQVFIPLAAVAEVLAVHAAGGYEHSLWRWINAGGAVALCTYGALAHNPAALIASLAPAVVGAVWLRFVVVLILVCSGKQKETKGQNLTERLKKKWVDKQILMCGFFFFCNCVTLKCLNTILFNDFHCVVLTLLQWKTIQPVLV